MKRNILRILALLLGVVLLAGILPAVPAEETGDVLAWARERDILTGSLAEARLDLPCSRGEAAALIWRCAGRPNPGREESFPDVIPSAWYTKAVAWAAEQGIVVGAEDGCFHPNRLCGRADLSLMLWRWCGSPHPNGRLIISDVDQGDRRFRAISWSIGHRWLTKDSGGRFRPAEACTREELLQALWRMDRTGFPKPVPARPTGTEPTPTQPAPTEPAPTQPVPTEPAPTQPTPTEPAPTQPAPTESAPEPTATGRGKGLIVIDPGHQRHANSDPEPLGPGSDQLKAKVSGGTYGESSGLAEFELTLTVSLLLRDELIRRGYEVRMTRETHDVDISNRERAEFANALGADCLIRIHANGSQDPSVHGALTVNMTSRSPYNAALYSKSRALSEALLDGLCAETGATRRMVWDTDTMSGINWSQVPVSIVEMGYMTNTAEDLLMASPDYQAKIARGLADGVDVYFAGAGRSN